MQVLGQQQAAQHLILGLDNRDQQVLPVQQEVREPEQLREEQLLPPGRVNAPQQAQWVIQEQQVQVQLPAEQHHVLGRVSAV